MSYRLSSLAERDLDRVWLYIAQDNFDAANRVIESIHRPLHLLDSNPGMGRPFKGKRGGLYRFPVANYIVVCRSESSHIEIARVLHGARNIDTLLDKAGDS